MDHMVIETSAAALQGEAEGLGLVQPEEAVAAAGKPLRQSDPGQGMKGISLNKRVLEWVGRDYFHHENGQA